MTGPPPIPPRPSGPPTIPPRPESETRPPGPPSFPPTIRGNLIADGCKPQAGVLKKGVKWQASGFLEQGANLPGQPVLIGDPYTIHMGPETTCVDEKGRQRNEFLSWPPSEPGQTHLYKWRFHLSPALPTSYKFFHMTQLFSREQGGFVLSLGLVHPHKIKISSFLPECNAASDNVLEVDAEEYWGRTVCHRMLVKWGPNGSIDYTVSDAGTNQILLRYRVNDVNVPAKGSIKCGLYRAHVCSAASAVVGDFDFTKRS
ncbi:hypothetical protein JCM16303_001002 [Sporobolomyces ruberrimus]